MSRNFWRLLRAVVNGETGVVSGLLARSPELATVQLDVGATRQDPTAFFFTDISHYVLAGDTALHMAAAAFQPRIAEQLVCKGADCGARNRRGAERAVRTRSSGAVAALVAGGADVHLQNKSGSTPLQLALQDTGRSGAGSARARDEQRKIIAFLLESGAGPSGTQ